VQFPLPMSDLVLLLFMIFIILLIITEALSPSYGKINILIDGKKLRNTTLFMLIILVIAIIPMLM